MSEVPLYRRQYSWLECGWRLKSGGRLKSGRVGRQIKKGDYSFPSPYWDDISEGAKDLVRKILQVRSLSLSLSLSVCVCVCVCVCVALSLSSQKAPRIWSTRFSGSTFSEQGTTSEILRTFT